MAEVIDWSPVDESNNSPPPVGAPEHHAPSATNNIMRAMMGAIRRWHDTVNTRLGTFLPLSGGTVTGNTSFNGPLGISIQGTWLDGDGAGNLVVRNVSGGSNAGAIASVGKGAAILFGDRNMVSPTWSWSANAGNAMLGTYGAAPIVNVTAAGNITITGNITASGFVDAATLRGNFILSDGSITATTTLNAATVVSDGSISAAQNIIAGGSINVTHNVTAGGNITAAAGTVDATAIRGDYILSDGNIDAAATLGAATVVSHGSISAAQDITAGGNITAAGFVDAATIRGNFILSDGSITATTTVNAAYIFSSGDINATGSIYAGVNVDAEGTVQAGFIQSLGYIAAAGNITSGGTVSSVHLTASGNITAAGSVNAAFVNSSGGIHANGVIDSDTNIAADGNVTASGNITAGGTVTGNAVAANSVNATNITGASVVGTTSLATRDAVGDITCGMFTSGTVSYLQFLNQPSNANRWEFNGSNGDLQWRSLNDVHWVMRRSLDAMCFNALGPVGGFGAYYNSSDRRFKEDIEPVRCGLETVLDLNPVSFKRIGQDDYEVGFIAQELREVMPEAVRVIGIPLPDDTGGLEDEDPTLGVDTTPIIAALVNAMKELSGRIKTLEGARQ